jgi:3-oxoacyl-[acyl-carrier-protein] synthase-3
MITLIRSFLPSKILTNEQLTQELGRWTAEEVFEKTGIRSRHIAENGETAVDLAVGAVNNIKKNLPLDNLDFLVLCTQTGDYKLPSSSCLVQAGAQIPSSCGCLDINLACSGYIYGLAISEGLLASGVAKSVLLVNSDTYTHYIHPQDTVCRPIFGDGAAASLLSGSTSGKVFAFSFGTDGKNALSMCLPAGGARHQAFRSGASEVNLTPDAPEFIRMNGPEIYNFTLHAVPPVVQATLRKASLCEADIDFFVFHQANAFMLESLRRKMNLPKEKFVVDMAETGNLVSASIPVVLEKMKADGRIRPGVKTLLCGFGVGLSWAACIIEW